MHAEWTTVAIALGLYAAVVVSPGLNFALITRLSIAGQRRAATAATLGLALAATLYAVLTMSGLAVVLTRIGWLAGAIQVAGGCYLVYLGARAWLDARAGDVPVDGETVSSLGYGHGLRMGMLVNLSNPKAIVFFLSLYAVAVPTRTALWAKLVILAGGFALEILWYNVVAVLFSTTPARASYQKFGHWIERAMGTVLASFGLRLIWEKA